MLFLVPHNIIFAKWRASFNVYEVPGKITWHLKNMICLYKLGLTPGTFLLKFENWGYTNYCWLRFMIFYGVWRPPLVNYEMVLAFALLRYHVWNMNINDIFSWIVPFILSEVKHGVSWLILFAVADSSDNALYINGLMQERHNSIANALELCLSCSNPSVFNFH